MKQIKVYGPGCKRCTATEDMVKEAALRLSIEVAVEKVTDQREIAMAGIMSTPGITIDGKLVHAGGLPDKAKLDEWLSA
ncbi:thioredoxin family protein (plasmid) [Pseudorhodobacter turbinis]|uniref:Thioredoxin family protein n=1 Tax=Pseudorhodobacter turbinis TaxID=2500533 RepID=A0A4P8EKQ3_9RHOB|nr:thioredoxin family protein [Pseudorhodobacter turbinis]QCO57811.1 thioredoxin family protein [Pseudorhodobacter turbinis]